MKKPIPFGKYYLLERVNVGGMAEVFKAKAYGVEGFERLVAVKRILPNIAEDKEFITMFIDEAKIAVQLNHANIAQIFDLGRVDDSYFIALEFVHGKDLRAIFDRCRQMGETMPIAQACFITMKVCEGLDYAHNKRDPGSKELNLVHRDISPQNVLLSYEGEIKIIDFGIAKAAGKASKTQAGILKGKFGYMSPEQVRGMPLDRRSDIFSVGIVLYELLTGERLFVGESDFSTLEKVRNVEILPPSTYNRRIPEELERIVLKALARDVEDRYQNAIDLHDELQAFMYTAGEFYSRKDLATWMKRIWRAEIEEETQKLKEYQSLPSPQPQPAAALDPFNTVDEYGTDPFAGSGNSDFPDEGPDLDWDEDEVETQLYDKDEDEPEPAGIDAAFNNQASATVPSARLPEMNLPQPSIPRRTSRGMGSVGMPMNPGPGVAPAAIQPDPLFASAAPMPIQSGSSQAVSELPPLGDFNLEVKPGTFDVAAADMLPVARPRRSNTGLLIGIVALSVIVVVGGGIALWYFLFRGGKKASIELKAPAVAGIKVYVDGDPVDIKPGGSIIKKVDPGTHWVTAVAPAHKDYENKFMLKGGSSKTVDILLVPLTATVGTVPGSTVGPSATAGKAKLKVTTVPPGATVVLNNTVIRYKTPLEAFDLKPGVHQVRITMPNYLDWPTEGPKMITLEAGKMFELSATLQPKVVMLIIKSDTKGAKVTILKNGKKEVSGKSAPYTHKITPDAQAHYKVVVDAKKYQKFEKDIKLTGQSEIVVEANLEESRKVAVGRKGRRPITRPEPREPRPGPEPRPASSGGGYGMLRINTQPWSKIYINGRSYGVTPNLRIKLKEGTYTLKLVNPEFGIRKVYTIKIVAGKTKTFIKRLSK